MEQQTAVEWLMTELVNKGLLVTDDYKNLVAYSKAKQMEREQIIDAVDDTHNVLIMNDIVISRLGKGDKDYGEMYYNEVYGK